MPNYRKIPSSPVALAGNLSLTAAVDGQQTPLKGRVLQVLQRLRQMRNQFIKDADYFDLAENRKRILVACPPPYVSSITAPIRCCRKYLFCPFCWARMMARDCYYRFERTLFGDNQPTREGSVRRRETVTGYDLFEFSEEFFMPDGDIEDIVQRENESLTHYDPYFKRARGILYLTTLEPFNGQIRVRPRLLAIVSSTTGDDSLPEESDGSVTCSRWINPDRDTVAQAVGRTCEYPLGLLKGPHEISMKLLKARSGRDGNRSRLIRYYGGLRGKLV